MSSMRESIESFPDQFSYEPVIVNAGRLKPASRFVVAGMGGSHWGANLLRCMYPDSPIHIHSDYGLPEGVTGDTTVIASSYSGTTEETLDVFDRAGASGCQAVAIATGKTLIEKAIAADAPYIQLPSTGIQPRMALGYSMLAMLKFMGREDRIKALRTLTALDSRGERESAKEEAAKLRDRILVVYASRRNFAIAQVWKIKLNETGKIPAFCNYLPEMNHHEMTGFDVQPSTKDLSGNVKFFFITDPQDDPRITRRGLVLERLLSDRGLPSSRYELKGATREERVIKAIIFADWLASETAALYGVEAEQVPMVEEFKRLIARD